MASTTKTLYHPDGRPYRTSSAAEVTTLKAQGYTETPPAKPAAKKATAAKTNDPDS